MHSPALALGWELWARHRRGWSVLGAGAIVAALLAQILPTDAARALGQIIQAVSLFAFVYLLSIFVFAEGTFGGKSAGFPPRLFSMPVRTSLLVAWPMLYGTMTVALLWLGMSWLILVPCGRAQTVPWWPALMLAAWLASFQAIAWTFVRGPLLRLVVAILGLPSIVLLAAVLLWAKGNLEFTSTQAILGLGAIIGVSYALGVAGVARDRRGERLGWAWVQRLLLSVAARLPACERSFASPMAAQRWLEVRRHAWLLPAFVGFFLAMLFWGAALPLTPVLVARIALAIVGFPVVLAFFVGFGMGKTSFWARDLELSSFVATRPLTNAALARAKLHAAGLSALVTWGLVILVSPLWTVLSGNVEVVRSLADAVFHDEPWWKLTLLAPIALVGLVGLTWLQIVAGMCLSLTGRAWVVNAVVLFYGAVLTAIASLGILVGFHPDFLDKLLIALWWLGGGLSLLKLSVAAWTWTLPGMRGDTAVRRLALLWLACAACLLAPLYAFVPDNGVPTHILGLFVVLALPFTRLLALSEAVAWNRHR